MTIARPMFPPRAESVDSFSLQSAIGQPEPGKLASESPDSTGGLSRRNMLAGLALLPAAVTAGAATPTEVDPVFAVIAAKRAADLAHGEAIEAADRAETRYGPDSEEAAAADQASADACWFANTIDWKLARTSPTTLAGVAAVLRFANQIEDEGLEWPGTDTIGREGWHYQFRVTLAAAIEAIIRKEVRS